MRRSLSELNLKARDLEAKSRRDLITLVQRLQSQARTMYQSLEYKSGVLDRIRDTILNVEDNQRRFYVLKPGCLLCFESATIRNLRGEIPLFESSTVKAVDDSNGRFVFLVLSYNQKLRFVASSSEERAAWMKAIRSAAKAGGMRPADLDDDEVIDEGGVRSPALSPTQLRQRKGFGVQSASNNNNNNVSASSAARSAGLAAAAAASAASDSPRTQNASSAQAANSHRGSDTGGASGSPLSSSSSSSEHKATERLPAIPEHAPSTVVKNTQDTSASRLMHKISRPSLLSSDSTAPQSYRGLFNLLAIVAVVSNVRLIVENFIKYGLLVGSTWFRTASESDDADHSSLGGILAFSLILGLNIALAVAAEKLGGFVSAVMVMLGTVMFMKLVSYAHACHDLRQKKAPAYSECISLRRVALFMAFPTLVYQTAYPRTARIRKRWLLKRVFELVLVASLMIIILEQFLVPTIRNASKPMREMNIPRMLERLLKLAIPSLILWLMMFYGLFHIWLNILAEITFFGDRLFYKEWWEAKRLDVYWRHWNLPVHNWLVRHCFFPFMNWGFSKSTAAIAVFLFSAAMHEFLVSAPFRIFRLWAFSGMMAQIPLIYITKELDKKLRGSHFEQVGNVVFWCSFCIVGQPLCILLYYFDLSQAS